MASNQVRMRVAGESGGSAFKECLDEFPFPTLANAYEISTW